VADSRSSAPEADKTGNMKSIQSNVVIIPITITTLLDLCIVHLPF
jgi:hypothetical protein